MPYARFRMLMPRKSSKLAISFVQAWPCGDKNVWGEGGERRREGR